MRSHSWMLFLSGEAADLRAARQSEWAQSILASFSETCLHGGGQSSRLPGGCRAGLEEGHCSSAHCIPSSQHGLQGEHSHGINSMGVWVSERAQRKAAVGSGTTEAVAGTCKSTLDVRMSIHDKRDLPDQADS